MAKRRRLSKSPASLPHAVEDSLAPVRPWWRSLGESSLYSMISAPVIYTGIVPILLLDLFTTVYQAACFKDYGIAKVDRKGYIIFDRHRLGYLNLVEKINCDYCAYFNGVIGYAREVAGRTEAHFCPIHHAARLKQPHEQYAAFTAYGDGPAYEKIVNAQLKRRGHGAGGGSMIKPVFPEGSKR